MAEHLTGDLTDAHGRPIRRESTSRGAPPTVIVDDLHITYRVYGAAAGKGNARPPRSSGSSSGRTPPLCAR